MQRSKEEGCSVVSQERHDVLAKERQSEFDRANAADVARSAQEVQLVAERERVAQLTAQAEQAAVQTQVDRYTVDQSRFR